MKKRSEMNEYEKAYDFVNNVTGSTDIDRIQPLKKLVDKETPMKPIKGGVFTAHDCPTCDDGYIEIENYYKLNRCVNCGQRIDWTDVIKTEEEER